MYTLFGSALKSTLRSQRVKKKNTNNTLNYSEQQTEAKIKLDVEQAN